MIALRLLSRDEVESRLRHNGCEKQDIELTNGDLWITPWEHAFFVPTLDEDKKCPEYILNEIIIGEIEGTRPTNH